MLTVEDLKAALPKSLQVNATQDYADKVNLLAQDPEYAREVRNNFVTFSRVLQDGKYKTDDYLHAVMYCTFKLMGMSNKDAYIRTFPDRYTAMRARGADDKQISSFVAAFHKNQLVNKILEQAHIPMWLVNQDVMQKAINIQLDIAMNANSEMARTAAANSLLVALKQPETKKIELDIGLKNGGGLNDLRESMAELVEKQRELIAQGAGAKLVGRIPIGQHEQGQIIDVAPTPAPAVAPAPAYVKPAQPASVAALNATLEDGLRHGMGVARMTTREVDGQVELVTEHVPRVSLFAPMPLAKEEPMPPVPRTPEDIKSPIANYAQCCDRSIEDCLCEDTDHIYLPVKADVPAPRRVSLFDAGGDMP